MRGPVQSNPPNGFDGAPLTNYLLNAHVFTRWGLKAETNRSLDNPRNSAGRLLPTTPPPVSDPAGYFAPPAFNYPEYLPVINGVDNMWGHFCSGTLGPIGRTFNHVVDGFSNTILAAECMRQCDAQRNFRYAFLPTGPSGTSTPFNEHSFGILPSLRSGTSGALFNTPFPSLTFGNTFMFQTQPKPEECNATRVQGLHGNYLMAAMCDGSVRAISSQVTRREPTGIMACGRLNHGTQFFDHRARGATAPDGIWDLLMMPADPPGSVLANTGEIGRER
jgi:prepilin-type processing-associated H-X9-DG protein